MNRILEALSESPATIADLADATGMNPDSCRAQLSQLRQLGAVRVVSRVTREVTYTRRVPLYAVASGAHGGSDD